MFSKKEGYVSRVLDSIDYPDDLKGLNIKQLTQLADELRQETINVVSKTGGHLGASLGVIELTIALHHVFNTPKDKIVWDVSHQVNPHKILTGRKNQMHTWRQGGGLAGFAKRSESEYDAFGAGHGGTSISAALGMAFARDLNDDENHVIAVIGDGSLTAGMAYEAMNNAGYLKKKLIVILNDNEMSIAPNLGAMHKYLCKLVASKPYLSFRHLAKDAIHHMPKKVEDLTKKAKQYAKDFLLGGNFFEEMGFNYFGPIDGHDINQLVPILKSIKDDKHIEHPVLIHIKTQKGKGFDAPNSCEEKFHAVSKFDIETKIQKKSKPTVPTYTNVFADTLTKIALEDKSVVAITAAMPGGTGLKKFSEALPDRMIDVGMSEQHAVTFAAGLACEGIKPFCTIYSTFLQRGYDQVVHDVALQNLPVRFAIDRAGFVGEDGPTHAGSFDIAFLSNLPNFVVMAASDENELARMVATSHSINDRPSAFRYPRGSGVGVQIDQNLEPLEIGKGRYIKKGSKIAVLSLGGRLEEVKKADQILKLKGLDITIADARFAKPLDTKMIEELASSHEVLITIEEGAIGGFASHVSNHLANNGFFDKKLKFRSIVMPDEFIDQDNQATMYEKAGMNADAIVNLVSSLI